MNRQLIERFFPNLSTSPYSITSPAEKGYNCIAWAAGDTNAWWEPDRQHTCFWPDSIPRIYTVDAYVKAFERLGFIRCKDARYEEGFEKVAIYFCLMGNRLMPQDSLIQVHGRVNWAFRKISNTKNWKRLKDNTTE